MSENKTSEAVKNLPEDLGSCCATCRNLSVAIAAKYQVMQTALEKIQDIGGISECGALYGKNDCGCYRCLAYEALSLDPLSTPTNEQQS